MKTKGGGEKEGGKKMVPVPWEKEHVAKKRSPISKDASTGRGEVKLCRHFWPEGRGIGCQKKEDSHKVKGKAAAPYPKGQTGTGPSVGKRAH